MTERERLERAVLERRVAAKRASSPHTDMLGSVMATAKDRIMAPVEGALAFGRGVSDTGSAGYDDNLTALMLSPFIDHDTALKDVQGVKAKARDEHPVDYTVGQIAGAVPGAVVAGTTLLPSLVERGMSALGADTLLGMLGGAAYGGGSEEESIPGSAIFGAAGGAIGRGAQQLLKYGKDLITPSETAVNTQLAGELFGGPKGVEKISGPSSIFDLLARQEELGPEAIGADLDPIIRAQMTGSMAQGSSIQSADELAQAAAARDIPTMADDSFLEVFGDPGTRAETREQRQAIRTELANEYENVLLHNDDTPTINLAELQGAVTNAFGDQVDPIQTRKGALDQVRAMVKAKGVPDEDGNATKPVITLRNAVDLMHEIDAMITRIPTAGSPDQSLAVNKGAYAALVETRKNIADILKSSDLDFAVISQKYASDAEILGAGRVAQQTFSNPNSELAADTATYYNQLSDQAKEHFRATAVYEIARKSASATPITAANRASGRNTSGALADTIRVVFGDKTATKLMAQADKLGTFNETNKAVAQSRMRRAEEDISLAKGSGFLKGAVDLTAMAAQAASGRFNSGPFMGPARREAAGLASTRPALVNTERARLGAESGEDLQARLMELYMLSKDKPAVLTGPNFGVLGGAWAPGGE